MDNNLLAAAVLIEHSGYGFNLSADITDASIAEMADEAVAFLVENDNEYREDHDNYHRPRRGLRRHPLGPLHPLQPVGGPQGGPRGLHRHLRRDPQRTRRLNSVSDEHHHPKPGVVLVGIYRVVCQASPCSHTIRNVSLGGGAVLRCWYQQPRRFGTLPFRHLAETAVPSLRASSVGWFPVYGCPPAHLAKVRLRPQNRRSDQLLISRRRVTSRRRTSRRSLC